MSLIRPASHGTEDKRRCSQFDVQLPTELWGMIIDLLVFEISHPYLYCGPDNFPQYEISLWTVNKTNTTPFLEDWRRIRAVCKKWKYFAGVAPYYLLKGWKPPRVDINPDIDSRISTIFTFGNLSTFVLESLASQGRHLTTLIFGCDDSLGITETDYLLDNPSCFPNLRCLSIFSTRTTKSFWKVIQDEYPNLLSLTVRSEVYGMEGQYILESLQILGLYYLEGFQLLCPSLKHFHLESGYSMEAKKFIIEHGPQLESFIGPLPREDDIWSSVFPNLITFGNRFIFGPPSPRFNHPLRNLYLITFDRVWTPSRAMNAFQEYSAFPNLDTFYFNINGLKQDTPDELRSLCRERGIRFVVVDGITVPVIKEKEKEREKEKEKPLTIMDRIKLGIAVCTGPCWYSCFVLLSCW